ncbi:hypothetical protein E2C01_020389 [Portunus trituberculatus]|uniref:Uncharacterized protein n=1 Tax=Portunus trituberculatus TaxID=210409 RepID=A0A5B7DZM5_PORTR|nr:hypothetical protein [Portunus trituberculatus]
MCYSTEGVKNGMQIFSLGCISRIKCVCVCLCKVGGCCMLVKARFLPSPRHPHCVSADSSMLWDAELSETQYSLG